MGKHPTCSLQESSIADCVFLLPERTDADAYSIINNADGRQVLHEVEVLDALGPTHTGWISHCTMQSGGSFMDQMEPKGTAYWSGEAGDKAQGREMLVKGAVKVIRRV